MNAYRRGSRFYVEFTDETGRRLRVSTKARTMREAKLLEAELRVGADRAKKGLQPGQRNPHRLTLTEGAKRWLAKKAGTPSHTVYGHNVAKHIDRTELGEALLEHVTPARIESYFSQLIAKEETSPATINRIRSTYSAIFRHLSNVGLWHGENPARKVEQRREPEHTDRLIAPNLVRILLEDAPDEDWRLVLALAAFAGLRRSEIQRLHLDAHVDLNSRVLTVVKSKTGAIRKVGVHRELIPLIKAARKRHTNLAAKTWQKSAVIVKDILEAAEIDGAEEAVFHGLRHTWASQLVDAGARVEVVEFMGWGRRKSSTFRKHYLDFPAARLVEEIDLLSYPPACRPETTAQTRHTPSQESA